MTSDGYYYNGFVYLTRVNAICSTIYRSGSNLLKTMHNDFTDINEHLCISMVSSACQQYHVVEEVYILNVIIISSDRSINKDVLFCYLRKKSDTIFPTLCI